MANVYEVCERIDKNTDKLSTQVRTLALGLLAFSGGILVSALTGSGPNAPKLPTWLVTRLFYIGVTAILALAIDLAQYGFNYLYLRSLQTDLDAEIRRRRDKEENFNPESVVQDYDEGDWRFVLARFCFAGKTLALLFGVAWLIVDTSVLLGQGGK